LGSLPSLRGASALDIQSKTVERRIGCPGEPNICENEGLVETVSWGMHISEGLCPNYLGKIVTRRFMLKKEQKQSAIKLSLNTNNTSN